MKKQSNNSRPRMRIVQDHPAIPPSPFGFDDPPKPNEGASVGIVILMLIAFVAGLVIGGVLW